MANLTTSQHTGTSAHLRIGASTQLWIIVLLVLISRIPFLFDGFGHEEDSWGLVVNAYEMHDSGHYVASRFPGHPFQEYMYLAIYDQPAWMYNAMSVAFSVLAVIGFYKALQRCGINYAFETTLMLAFVPMFYIAGTYTIDYAWSLGFVMLSFWAITSRQLALSGLLLGMAIGCRITSGVFILPWAMLLWNRLDMKQWLIDVIRIGIPMGLVGIAWYIPAFVQYGGSFFDYSDQFPYPPLTKITYKASIGVFGLLGIVAILFALAMWFKRKDKSALHPPSITSPARMTWIVVVICALHVISYLRLPQKAGYMLAMVPFILLLVTMYSTRKAIRVVTVLFVLSSFIFSINLTDALRGSESSSLAVRFHVSGQEIFLDPVSGPIFSEQSKRRNKMEYVERVCDQLDSTRQSQIVICGWWYNEMLIEFRNRGIENVRSNDPVVLLKFYETCNELQRVAGSQQQADGSGMKIYFLPEQDLYNDQMFGQSCTNQIAEPFPLQ